ncbi:MAG: glycosyltransferase family 4 protein [Alphaproteobacteria bacterium]|jgi:glycosyltransferase involved in cell wall biosynthesis|nr:glycosyltransferase family 4 protein [Alphaproteobacteria bacterium]
MTDSKRKLVFLITELGYFCSHRLSLAKAAKQAGFEVGIITNCEARPQLTRYETDLKQFDIFHVPFHRSRLNPFAELKTLWQIGKLYRKLRPNIVHQVALKPVIYGTIWARLTGMPRIINALGGMGYLFTHRTLKSGVIRPILSLTLRILLKSPQCELILQNPDDADLMAPLVGPDKIHLIRGAGVDLKAFYPTQPSQTQTFNALMVSRLLWSKGLSELNEAAKILKREGIPLQIQVAGGLDPQNPASVPAATIEAWKAENVITWLGPVEDVASLYALTDIAVLPSYREGLPKSLLEAAACGKPIVTTDVPGCREVVSEGENGILVPPKDAKALANALKTLVESSELRLEMGRKSRVKAELEFDEQKIIAQTLEVYG